MDQATLQEGIQRGTERVLGDFDPPLSRGVVVALHTADSGGEPDAPGDVLCDVLLARGGVVRATVMQRGSSIGNVSRWTPAPAQTNLVTGIPVKLINDQLIPPPSDWYDLDGEIVVVAWLEGSPNRPTIIGSLEHPRGARATRTTYAIPDTDLQPIVRTHAATDDRYLAHAGTTARIDRGGSVRLDLRRAGVANNNREYGAPGQPAGLVDVSLRTGAEVIIRNEAGIPVARVMATATGAELSLGIAPTDGVLLAAPTLAHLLAWEGVITQLASQVSAMSALFATAQVTADGAGVPAPVQVPPGIGLVPYAPVLPTDAGTDAAVLRSDLIAVQPNGGG